MNKNEKTVSEKQIIKLWKKKGVDRIELEFSCGGDSMGDTEYTIHLENGEEDHDSELEEYFENIIYDKVEFYVNSDGHYEGESGTVVIRLNDEGDDFEYDKTSVSEWNESATEDVLVKLTPKEKAFLKDHVLNINGGGEEEMTTNYKHDFVITTPMEKLVEKLEAKIQKEVEDTRGGIDVENMNEWYTFTTGEGDLEFDSNKLKIVLTYSYLEYKDGDEF